MSENYYFNILKHIMNWSLMYIVFTILIGGLIFYLVSKKQKRRRRNSFRKKNTPITAAKSRIGKTTNNRPKATANKVSITTKKHINKDETTLKSTETTIKSKKSLDTSKTTTSNELSLPKKEEVLQPDTIENSKIKYIGYDPINIFAQTEPLSYPYVIMPNKNSVIKFPRKGRVGRKGFKEGEFYLYLIKYFKNKFQILDDRYITTKNQIRPFEPDFTLIDEALGKNIFIDIEIDEPYEGINDLNKRQATHYQQSNKNRDNAFKNRGWIVIRFAEIQIHQNPDSCCQFIADVIKSINPKYSIPKELVGLAKIKSIKQWTKNEAIKWSNEKYREKYLGIDSFGLIHTDNQLNIAKELDIEKEIEIIVKDDKLIHIPIELKKSYTNLEKINLAINSGRYLSFVVKGEKCIIKPISISSNILIAFCYVKNSNRSFDLNSLEDLNIKETYYTLRLSGPTIGVDKITNAVNQCIAYNKLIRMKYTRAAWTNMLVNKQTGELLIDKIEAEESIRTISNVQRSIDVLTQKHIDLYKLNSNYITAYCHKREEQRTFRFDRIGEIEILNIT